MDIHVRPRLFCTDTFSQPLFRRPRPHTPKNTPTTTATNVFAPL